MKMGCLRTIVLGAMVLLASTEAFAPSQRFAATSSFTQSRKSMAPVMQKSTGRTTSSSSLQMVVSPGVAVAAITGAFTGGLFAGSLHAISGELSRVFMVLWIMMMMQSHVLVVHSIFRPRSLSCFVATMLWTTLVSCRSDWCGLGNGTRSFSHTHWCRGVWT